ncbi:N-6 DNA methylase [Streptomyces sp. RerS4]|uniref:N-6 DNA methylase n=1 Tax=Streptomyces sp. RerS4 TaxID=2942449 RepID=UPI00201C1A1E|nr:N-6 DNA methylase [Streptomyces sp. RerS4]UQX01480.1 N-6 DNA methylase [Streptomyces sp. RerS4]
MQEDSAATAAAGNTVEVTAERTAEVTAAGIARLAGVGRAAVSNWRRRHPDFPKPVGGTETSPSFALSDVENWLRAQGKLAEVPLRERVWQQVASHPGGAVAALVDVGAALLLVRDRPARWLELTAGSDERMAALLPDATAEVLDHRLGPAHPPALGRRPGGAPVPLLRAAAELAAGYRDDGARKAFEFLLGRHLDANPRQYTLTPDGCAALMAALAGPGVRTALDPACGTGGLLRALDGADALHAEDVSPELAALAALRLALHGSARVRAAAADSLRADTFAGLAVDAVLCHPPFNERAWGHEELAYDPRWEYGLPARTESELAWVQHALAHLREGGTAVLLMPPAVAARRSGRRIRADLLRRGALRAVVSLPAGAAPPYGIPLQLWVLRRPAGPAPAGLLLVDTAGLVPEGQGQGQPRGAWPAVHDAVLAAWTAYDRTGATDEVPGVSRVVPVVELLDDEVDLTPARHLPPPGAGGGLAELTAVRERLDETLSRAARLTPPTAAPADGSAARTPQTTIGELARAGALLLRAGTATATASGADGGELPLLTEHDVHSGGPPSATTTPAGPTAGAEEPIVVEPGDVVVPVVGAVGIARVVTADPASGAGAVLGRNLQLLRPDPAALDPWFLAGFLRGTANTRRASSHASTATRLDVRRLRLPRLAPAEQRRYGARFRALAEFEDVLRQAGRLGEQLVQGLYDGLSDGSVTPD